MWHHCGNNYCQTSPFLEFKQLDGIKGEGDGIKMTEICGFSKHEYKAIHT
jgi:hypothetical protein